MLAPDAVPDAEFLIELGKKVVAGNRGAPWAHTALAGAELRNGRFENALRALDQSDRQTAYWESKIANDFLRAIALVHLGRAADARPLFERAAQYADEHLASRPNAPYGDLSPRSWHDWHAIQILRREAEAVLREADAAEKPVSPGR
jgi:tetratricopeptide (TPR) repeat protein